MHGRIRIGHQLALPKPPEEATISGPNDGFPVVSDFVEGVHDPGRVSRGAGLVRLIRYGFEDMGFLGDGLSRYFYFRGFESVRDTVG